MRDHILFGFGTTISLDAKTHSVPKFIGAPQHNFEIVDLGIKLSVPLALDGRANPNDTLFPSVEDLHDQKKCVTRVHSPIWS